MYDLIIVEDEDEVRNGLMEFFPWEKFGFHAVAAFDNGRAALEYCRKNKVDVVLTDIRMPFFSGFDLIRELSSEQDPPLFCIMTAYSDFEYAKEAIRYSVQDYIVKPASFDEISSSFLRIKERLDSAKVTIAPANNDNPLISQALEIIERKTASCTLSSVSAELGVNSSHLSRLFKEKTGENFQNYLIRQKMRIAVSMLESHIGYKNNDIAAATGYSDVQNFCRIFTKYYGVSPQQYRKNFLRGQNA